MAKTKKKATRKAAAKKLTTMAKRSRSKPGLVKASANKGELKYIPWDTVELENLNPLLQRQLVVGQDIMVARVLMKKGCIIPLHSHHNEQVTYILEGALKFWIDGKEIVVNAGEVLTIPRDMPHKAEALVDTVDLDVFNPPRADWINQDDRYLRADKDTHQSDRLWKQG
jgi:quercetin dioxygenase-like cupin family protein